MNDVLDFVAATQRHAAAAKVFGGGMIVMAIATSRFRSRRLAVFVFVFVLKVRIGAVMVLTVIVVMTVDDVIVAFGRATSQPIAFRPSQSTSRRAR